MSGRTVSQTTAMHAILYHLTETIFSDLGKGCDSDGPEFYPQQWQQIISYFTASSPTFYPMSIENYFSGQSDRNVKLSRC
jgi:hypothetical protein